MVLARVYLSDQNHKYEEIVTKVTKSVKTIFSRVYDVFDIRRLAYMPLFWANLSTF
jgi:hypothetical protein